MDPSAVTTKKLEYITDKLPYVFIKYNGKKLKLKTPPLKIAFGVDMYFDKPIGLKLRCPHYRQDKRMQNFVHKIQELEQAHKDTLEKELGGETSIEMNSQVEDRGKYGMQLATLLNNYRGRISCNMFDSVGNRITSEDLCKGDMIRCEIVCDRLWVNKGKVSCKWKVHRLDKV